MRRITNVRLPQPLSHGEDNYWWLLLDEKDVVLSVNAMESGSALAGENWGGDWLSPMGIDLQINGGLGLAFPELTFDQLPLLLDLLDRLWLDGVEAICPTFISCPTSSLRLGLDVLREARNQDSSNRCKLLGAHLEGPFLAKDRKGAHAEKYLCPPSLFVLDELIGGFENEIGLVTMAPELLGSLEVIEKLKNLDIVISLGHSSADDGTCRLAFANGVMMLTHAFNAMPGLHHRAPGPLGEAIKNGKIFIGLIADGLHVEPNVVVLLQRLASNQLVLVSDALSPYGQSDGQYEWDGRLILSHKGSCKLENGTLAGSTVPLLEACKNLARWTGNPSSAIWSATISPRLVLFKGPKNNYDFLLGKPLRNLLRWGMNSQDNCLCWHRAA